MIKNRTIATVAALGGLTAAIALMAGAPSAKADELADLRANQELLQQRLDQLSQAGPATGPAGPIGVGSFPRSFLIPGTDTSLRVGGNITFITDYYLQGGTANGSPWSTTLGTNGQVQAIGVGATANAKGSNDWGESARQSQLTVETRTPTPYGEARTYMSFDWAGSTAFVPGGTDPSAVSDNLVPRLKYAYGTLGGWLAGQANSNFEDPDANGETLDFGGNVGEPGRVRVAQLRYTMPLSWQMGGALSFSAENPEVEAIMPAGICGTDAGAGSACSTGSIAGTAATVVNPTKPAAPDLTAALFIPQPWGHVDIGGVLRPGLELSDGVFLSRDFVGGGGAFNFDVRPGWFTAKDDIIFHFVGGLGLGAYLNSSTSAALQTSYAFATTAAAAAAGPAGTAAVQASLVPSYGGEIGYQHWWSDNLRSNINYGIEQQNFSAGTLGATESAAANHRLQTAHGNLIWNPVSFVTVGVEWMWGRRTVLAVPAALASARSENMQALIGKFDVAF